MGSRDAGRRGGSSHQSSCGAGVPPAWSCVNGSQESPCDPHLIPAERLLEGPCRSVRGACGFVQVGKCLQMRTRARISTGSRVLNHLRYRFILRRLAEPVLDYFINIAETPSPEFAEFDCICIFLAVVILVGIKDVIMHRSLSDKHTPSSDAGCASCPDMRNVHHKSKFGRMVSTFVSVPRLRAFAGRTSRLI